MNYFENCTILKVDADFTFCITGHTEERLQTLRRTLRNRSSSDTAFYPRRTELYKTAAHYHNETEFSTYFRTAVSKHHVSISSSTYTWTTFILFKIINKS